MRASNYLFSTVKEVPSDAVVVSHQLMFRSGMIRKLASGLYTWLPTGLKVLRKVEAVIRDEMNKAGALEVMMPVVQPQGLWDESGRWHMYGKELLRLEDRHNNTFCLGPTHEEVITDLARNEINSYKQLPMNFYQVQTKFRDEIRPRFGVMRSREFIMKDAYSFHVDEQSLQDTYDMMYKVYCTIFERLGLDFRPVLANTGSIGGSSSHEFHVLADSGEDAIAFSDSSDYAANIELAECIAEGERAQPTQNKVLIDTPNTKTITELSALLHRDPKQIVKTLIVKVLTTEHTEAQFVVVVLRGDHELNCIKLVNYLGVSEDELEMASDKEIQALLSCSPGSIGPVGLPDSVKLIVDHSAAVLSDFVCGANQDNKHFQGVNWVRDCAEGDVLDIRNIVEGDASPCGNGKVVIKRGIEVGHIFQLGTKYSDALGVNVLGDNGKPVTLPMGCYGIGLTRVVAAAIEQNHDEWGIVWPEAIAPYSVAIIPSNIKKSEREKTAAEALYNELLVLGIDVFFDDREKERIGAKFADSELMGIPHRIVVNEKLLDEGKIEYKPRSGDKDIIDLESVISFLDSKMK